MCWGRIETDPQSFTTSVERSPHWPGKRHLQAGRSRRATWPKMTATALSVTANQVAEARRWNQWCRIRDGLLPVGAFFGGGGGSGIQPARKRIPDLLVKHNVIFGEDDDGGGLPRGPLNVPPWTVSPNVPWCGRTGAGGGGTKGPADDGGKGGGGGTGGPTASDMYSTGPTHGEPQPKSPGRLATAAAQK